VRLRWMREVEVHIVFPFGWLLKIGGWENGLDCIMLTLARACFSATPSAPSTAAVIDSTKVAPLEPEKGSSA